MRAILCAALLVAAAAAEAAVTDYIGRLVVEVRVQSAGADLRDPALLDVIETRVGAPLAMRDVRESMAHLFGLGLYQDVQVSAVLKGDGVALHYNLVPAPRVRRILFEGSPGVPEEELRRLVTDRLGTTPSTARASQAVAALQALYRERGYPAAEVAVRTEYAREPSNASIVFTVRPGPRARVASIEVQGAPLVPPAAVLDEVDLHVGDEYDGVALDARLTRYAEEMRGRGYFEARATHLTRVGGEGQAVHVSLQIEPGPRVEIVFQGDPLTEGDRDRLVPLAREHSVDEDLLEDSKFSIERHFRERGYCHPRADYERAEADGVLRVTFTVARGLICIVEGLDVTGNTSIPSAELGALILTRAGQLFSESVVAADVSRLQGYYRQRGFSGVKVSSRLEQRESAAGAELVRVTLAVAEGVRSIIERVAFDGNAALTAEALGAAVVSAPGQPYFEPQITADADAIALLYLNQGFQEVSVQPAPTASADGARVDLRFLIREGPKVLVDHILVVGNARTRRETILREVQFRSGQPLSQQYEDDTRARLTALGLFRRVDISYLQLPGQQQRRDVIITVEEAPVTTIGFGGGVEGGKRLVRTSGTSEAVEEFQVAPRGFFEVSRRNLFGKDRSLNLFTSVSFRPKGLGASPDPLSASAGDGGYGFNEYLARVTYGERRILGSDADATLSAGIEQGVRSSFDFNRRGASATITRRVGRTLAVSGRYGLDHTRLLNIKSNFAAQPEIDRLFPQVRLSGVSSSLIRDTRNDSLEPNTGSLVGADVEVAARSIGSQVGFFKTFLQGFAYRTLPGLRSTILVLGARAGLARGFPRTVDVGGNQVVVEDLPASERFYAGGDSTVRGFALDRLGTPRTIDADGFPTGGHGLIVLNGELRVPLRGVLGGVVFLDGGNVFSRVDEIDLGALRGAAGVGLRYRSPVGPIRVDVGFKLDRRLLPTGQRERPTALHISLGQAF